MKAFIVLGALLAVAYSQYAADESPKPYAFEFEAIGEEGEVHKREETADGSGTVRGMYSLREPDGRDRVVDYIAGPDGFSANIRTNEPGTANSNPADVVIESTAEQAGPMMMSVARPETRVAPAAPRVMAPQPRPAERGSTRYVLVPETDPRARAYYGAGGAAPAGATETR